MQRGACTAVRPFNTSLALQSAARGREKAVTGPGPAAFPLTFIFTGDLWGSSSASSPATEEDGGKTEKDRGEMGTGSVHSRSKVNKRQRGGASGPPGSDPGRTAGVQLAPHSRSAPEPARGPPRPRPPLATWTGMLNSEPRTERSGEGEKGRAPPGLPSRPGHPAAQDQRASVGPIAPGTPRVRPAPRLPSARPGPAVAAAECHGAIAVLPSLCTMSGGRSPGPA